MSKARSMYAGSSGSNYGVNKNSPGNGNGKWQGLWPSVGHARNARLINTRAGGDNRNVVFCMNQLGGVGRISNMFATTADGVKEPCPGAVNSKNNNFKAFLKFVDSNNDNFATVQEAINAGVNAWDPKTVDRDGDGIISAADYNLFAKQLGVSDVPAVKVYINPKHFAFMRPFQNPTERSVGWFPKHPSKTWIPSVETYRTFPIDLENAEYNNFVQDAQIGNAWDNIKGNGTRPPTSLTSEVSGIVPADGDNSNWDGKIGTYQIVGIETVGPYATQSNDSSLIKSCQDNGDEWEAGYDVGANVRYQSQKLRVYFNGGERKSAESENSPVFDDLIIRGPFFSNDDKSLGYSSLVGQHLAAQWKNASGPWPAQTFPDGTNWDLWYYEWDVCQSQKDHCYSTACRSLDREWRDAQDGTVKAFHPQLNKGEDAEAFRNNYVWEITFTLPTND